MSEAHASDDSFESDPTGSPGTAGTTVDWEFAKTTGARLVAAGPSVTPSQAAEEVAAIRAAAAAAYEPVAGTSLLRTPPGAPAALVIDRPTWIAKNLDSMSSLLDPAFAKILSARAAKGAPAGIGAVGAKVAGAEAGALMAFMASKVLGQYDLAPGGTPYLMLVAPNLLHVQRELEVDPVDFRAWVCMHEETHRVQFTAVPWLRQHMIDEARRLATDMTPDPDELSTRIQQILTRLPEAIRSGGAGIAELLATPEQRAKMAELAAVMSLLEGHADVVMDEVGPQVIPTVATIRARFNERRKGVGAADRILRRLLGLEAKMAQYRDGAAFVRSVVDQVGWEGLNAVWTSPETLPKAAEIADARAWVTRVHG